MSTLDSGSSELSENTNPLEQFKTFLQAALFWFNFGFNIIPITPGTKRTAVKWDPWLADLSSEKITEYWSRHPHHELGCIVDDSFIVFDSDSPESIVALAMLEKAFDLTPSLIAKTTKGEHHYFKRAKGTFAKTDSHSTEKHPDRIDLKANRSMVVLAPSTGKEVEIYEVDSANELEEIGQDFIDAVARHNGREVPRAPEKSVLPKVQSENQSKISTKLSALLEYLDPDSGYNNWLSILMAIYHETGGSEEGFQLANQWSSKGKTYKDSDEIRLKWNSFKSGSDNPITIATLYKMIADKGIEISPEATALFEVINPEEIPVTDSKVSDNPFAKYSIVDELAEIEKNSVEAKPLLGEIALYGQSTVIYAAPGSGKTLITLNFLMEGANNGTIDPSKVNYLSMDDTGSGLVEKLHLAKEYGFHMLADGYGGFSISMFTSVVAEMVESDQVRGVVIILDTLKKFVDTMDKRAASAFSKVIRRFVLKGGTVISLAHINKKLGANGKPVYGGTSDIVDDCDCAYTLATVSSENGVKVVEFENIKRRGNVVDKAAYSYCIGNNIPYTEILASVSPVDEQQVESLKQAEMVRSDAEMIEAVTACINDGIITKMKLADAVAKQAQVSKRAALQVIEKYSGDDPTQHRWNVTVKARGAKVFTLLAPN